jgi:alpha-galactosidase
MAAIKVTIIGAGSRFAFSVVSDLMRVEAFAGSTVALVDTNANALDLSVRVINQMVKKAGGDLVIEQSTDRREVLGGSDFVLNSISVGEPWAREKDVAIGEQHGIFQPTSQTVGPAGFMRGVRVVPHVVAIAHDIADLCPNATILDLANPLAAVCRSMIREANLKVIGLCEQWAVTLPNFSELLGTDDLDCLSVGTNHLTFALGLFHNGQDVLPEFLKKINSEEGKSLRERLPVSYEIYDAFGLWPTGTEEHIAEFFPYFLTPETDGGMAYNLRTRHTTEEVVAERRAEREAWASGEKPIDHLLEPSGESAVDIIASLLGVIDAEMHMVNVPNNGLIDNLPDEAIVELPAHIGPGGVRGLKVGALPRGIAQFLDTRVAQQEVLIDAALSGDPNLALQGLLLDTQVTSLTAAREILTASLSANADWLPNFKTDNHK